MKAVELYDKIKDDFIKDTIKDMDWALRMPGLDKYLFPLFKQNGGIGLMCDFTDEINKVYTTVFLSEKVLSKILNENVSNVMLFSHHPTNWDLKEHNGNYPVEEKYIAKLKERNISLYILHHPLDNFGEYSTCATLANQLGITVEKPAFLFYGVLCGVIGRTDCKTVDELHERYSQVVGHKTSLYQYGSKDIYGEKVAVCPGGGNFIGIINEMLDNSITTLITGVTIVNEWSREVHAFEKKNGINLLGGTHYSSEKYAMMEICNYFNKLGLPSEFIEDEPDLFDL